MPSEKAATIRQYFERMTAGDIEGIIGMFADDGFVVSPFLGTVPTRPFFEKLGNASSNSVLTVHDVLIGEDGSTGAGHFRYDWTLADGSQLTFEGVDHFTFDDDRKFKSMKIYYDTHPLRREVGDKYANA
ncbi:nuclear transport factor 2 family protein [Hoeflea poritis]|uniref:Nuclear transport factor 2 family protein n=1 Tax=Hoeflea poritis TaxID=2993659 RepID=A0ABT4VMX2_9HYPH|nr:nuclear transport factor 2 family protein [Hoeflea poritis]MDA4846066.1 nuclear transport factor 2 family protein [Hoeflea poritis]